MPDDLKRLRELLEKGTPGPWQSMRDGNQYIGTVYMPTARVVGASKLDGPKRPWNPHRCITHGFNPLEFETARFTDQDADLIAAMHTALPALLDRLEKAEALPNVWYQRSHKAQTEAGRVVWQTAADELEQALAPTATPATEER